MIQVIIDLEGITSIKDKRQIIHSLRDRIVRKFKVSAAEVDLQDSLGFSQLGAALVSNSKSYGEKTMHKILDFLEEEAQGRITDVGIHSEQF